MTIPNTRVGKSRIRNGSAHETKAKWRRKPTRVSLVGKWTSQVLAGTDHTS